MAHMDTYAPSLLRPLCAHDAQVHVAWYVPLCVQVPENVCKDRHNNVRRVRLWTSSLQRTIRTVRAAR